VGRGGGGERGGKKARRGGGGGGGGGGGQMWSEIALPSSAPHHIQVKHKANNKYQKQ